MSLITVRKLKALEVIRDMGVQTVVFECSSPDEVNRELEILGIHGVRLHQLDANRCSAMVDFTIWNDVKIENNHAVFYPTCGGMYDRH